jgi:3-deoxy-D-manno-octulosonate 8-phosphate phosphatase (KDO 8-P phosphatase)
MSSPAGPDLRRLAQQWGERLRQVRLVVLDVDGVLTDGTILWMGGELGWTRRFHVHDGFGIKLLLRAGLPVAALSADDNPAMRARLDRLGITLARFGQEDKRQGFAELQQAAGVDDAATLFMGDELYDVPLIRRAGLGVSVPGACVEAREAADLVTHRPGGGGAVREICDLLRYAQGLETRLERRP